LFPPAILIIGKVCFYITNNITLPFACFGPIDCATAANLEVKLASATGLAAAEVLLLGA
jgi:hypothetical protein